MARHINTSEIEMERAPIAGTSLGSVTRCARNVGDWRLDVGWNR